MFGTLNNKRKVKVNTLFTRPRKPILTVSGTG